MTDSQGPTATRVRVRLLPEVIAAVEQELKTVLDGQAALQVLVVATLDGRKIAAASRQSINDAKLGALSSTMLSMSAAAVKEAGGRRAKECLVMHDLGMLCITRLAPDAPFVLCATASSDLNLGMLISCTRRLGGQLVPVLDRMVGA